MTAANSTSQFAISSRSKLLFSALAAVLLFVALLPPVEKPEVEITTSSPSADIKLAEVSYHATAARIPSMDHWPAIDLDSALAVNPFAPILVSLPSQSSSQSASTDTSSTTLPTAITGRAHDKVDIIYENDSERVAVIGSRIVRVGDRLPEGRVIEITAKQVMLDVNDAEDRPAN